MDEDEDTRRRNNLIVLAIAVAIVIAGWLLIHEIVRLTKLQDCALGGRHDCEPINSSP